MTKIKKDIIKTGNLLRFNKTRNRLMEPNKKCEKVKETNIKEYLFSVFISSKIGHKRIIDDKKIKRYENIFDLRN